MPCPNNLHKSKNCLPSPRFRMSYGIRYLTFYHIKNQLIRLVAPLSHREKCSMVFYMFLEPIANGILYVLRTDCQWKMLPKEFGFGSTCHRLFQQWIKRNEFKKIWTRSLKEYDGKRCIKLTWQYAYHLA